MRKLPLLLLALYTVMSFTSCSKNDTDPAPTPKHLCNMMFVNGCAGATQVKGYYGGKAVDGASSIGYFENSGYQYVVLDSPVLSQAISFNNASNNALLKDTSFICSDNIRYSAFLGGSLTQPTITFTEDIYGGMGSNVAKIRFVNLTPDVPNVTFQVGTATIFSGINPSQITNFTDIPVGTTGYTAFDPTNRTATERVFGLRVIETGKYYTVFYSGTATGTGNNNLQLTQLMYKPQ